MRLITLILVPTLAGCGYGLSDDPEVEQALEWAREFKADQPEISRTIAKQCEKKLTSSPYWTRQGALELFQCIRREAEAQGYA